MVIGFISRLQVGWVKQVRTTGKHRIKIPAALYACGILVIRFANILAVNYTLVQYGNAHTAAFLLQRSILLREQEAWSGELLQTS